MATITEKFTQLKNSLNKLLATKASCNLDNLSDAGLANLQFASMKGILGNVCTKSVKPAYSGTTYNALTITGTFSGLINAGRDINGVPKSAEANDIVAKGTVTMPGTGAGFGSNGTTAVSTPVRYTLFINVHGALMARKLVMSWTSPIRTDDTMWYQLNENLLKYWDTPRNQWTTYAGFKIGEVVLSGGNITSVVFDGGIQLLDAGAIIRALDSTTVPVGTIIAYTGSDIPVGYLPLDGRYLSTTTYAALYSVIGTTQQTTAKAGYFQLANMTDGRYLRGATSAGGRVAAAIPNITGQFGGAEGWQTAKLTDVCTGPFYQGTQNVINGNTSNEIFDNNIFMFNAARCSSVYSSTNTVTPLSLNVRFLIKY